ncbi:MAG: arginine--tRNA ligase [candidate division FCPU426 bacterium]
MTLRKKLDKIFGDAFAAAGLDRSFGLVQESARPDLCQFQCNGALAAAKASKANPRALAEAVLAAVDKGIVIRDLSLAGPGFINITLTDAFLADIAATARQDPRLGVPPADPRLKILVDFGGPNVAKPMHVGHLRSAIIGDSLQRLNRLLGHDVVSDVHLGDWGTQMGMLIEEVRLQDPGLPYFDPEVREAYPLESPVTLQDLEAMYPRASSRCKADPVEMEKARQATFELQNGRAGYRALWSHFCTVSKAGLKDDFGALGVEFTYWYGESDDQKNIPGMISDLKQREVAVISEGATVILLDDDGSGAPLPPLLLVKSDGAYLYGTTDLASLRRRVAEDKADRILYVADKRQSLHFRQVFLGVKKSGYLGQAVAEHIGFGTVNGPDGKPFKTRAGGVMKLGDLISMARTEAAKRMAEGGIAESLSPAEREKVAHLVGMAAVKYSDLCNPRSSDYVFDIEKFTQFEGRTGPYLLYAAVRMKSILRKALERGFGAGALLQPSDFERPLFLKIAALPDALERAGRDSMPNLVCDYAFELAGAFSTFYQNCNILREEDPARRGSWLALTGLTLQALECSLGVLGLETPESM